MCPLTRETSSTSFLPARARRVFSIALRRRLILDATAGRALLVGGGAVDLLVSHHAGAVLVNARSRRRRGILGVGRHIKSSLRRCRGVGKHDPPGQREARLQTAWRAAHKPGRRGNCSHPHADGLIWQTRCSGIAAADPTVGVAWAAPNRPLPCPRFEVTRAVVRLATAVQQRMRASAGKNIAAGCVQGWGGAQSGLCSVGLELSPDSCALRRRRSNEVPAGVRRGSHQWAVRERCGRRGFSRVRRHGRAMAWYGRVEARAHAVGAVGA